MRHLPVVCLVSGFVTLTGPFAFAQRATIQQPVVSTFGVNTTVSVPDRGRAHLGSLSRAGESRKAFGPFVRGSSRGSFRDHSSTSVGVRIHDFEEMDRRLLGRTSRFPTGPRLSSSAENAYQSLLAQHTRGSISGFARQPISSNRYDRRLATSQPRKRDVTESVRSVRRQTSGGSRYAEKFLADGLRAEDRGAYTKAKNYYQTAARLGSRTAKRRFEILERKPSASVYRR